VGGEFDLHGVTFVGLPYLGMACNAHLAWANTVNQPDLSDLYALRLKGKTGYEYDGQTRELSFREFVFKIKGGGDVAHKIAYSHHGPLLAEGIAVRKSGAGEAGLVTQIRAQGLATTTHDYREALAQRGTVMFNHLFGDARGQVGYVWGGRIPRRPEGFDFSAPVPGWTSATEWGEPVAFAELPQCATPPLGFLQSCNDGPARTGAGASLTPLGPFPSWLAPDSQTPRGHRLLLLLEQAGPLELESARAIAQDCRDLSADGLVPWYLREGPHGLAQEILKRWDRTLTRESRGAALFQLAQREGGLVGAMAQLSRWGLPLDVAWGEVHRHQRGRVDLPMDGGVESLCPNSGEPGPDGRTVVTFGSSFRMVAQLSEDALPELWAAQPYGNSDDPDSPHFTDQMELACTRGWRRVPWTRGAVESECTARLTLS
jgi:acyl-homoserine-lactone acylase